MRIRFRQERICGAPMARPDFLCPMLEFQSHFATEAACLDYLAASRWGEGFIRRPGQAWLSASFA